MVGLVSYVKGSSVSHLLLAITFFVSGLIINLTQALLYYGLRPFSKYLYRKINYYVCYSLYCQLVFMAEWWASTDLVLYIDKEDLERYYGKEHGFLIMNHRYEVDWLMGWVLCDRVNILGNCKTFAKKSIRYVPTMGWAWLFAESIFLERNWEKDKETIGRQIKELVEHPDPIWLLLMAEGTRFTTEKHEASKKFAEEKGLPVLKHHLTPRTKGFTTSLPYLHGKFGGIYDVQLSFKEGERPTMTDLLLGKRVQAHLYIGRIPLDQVPVEEETSAQWLYQLYQKKDRMSDSFFCTGDFFAESGVMKIEGYRLPRRYFSLINTVAWGFVVLVPMVYYLLRLLTSGSTIYFSVGIGIIGIFFWLLSKMIGMTKISKASSYGKTTTTPTETKDSPSATKKTE
ncbi:1-acyl-sn-glycerol-3-phosphate acyltransferase gamma [Cryptotermes secundus]|uniref:1-acyl-sn-glycerol-3-phosphate acyltransferase gamma n=1 Tax=Cryptotermes secundus TaxID=105785 RepID=A0A2J7R9F0_9NEOP|nr:1-acyl-sn-glycerol-3-phosphate acyltransferase gamma [Cryptotermes secundus]XP_023703829.1 1-acyl-sn-glycerol-3-phosphate acyltransferase gamma [Cryptotermes secundus]PNF37469.1 1-acyl-sn-glycerol-3-phosphate acyltransferase gamma [Cryptotermes secundus]PNF37470.1 1-acyl-sn-glycerol-3-phosphate acyltransferase gamma [Cryptotermes secundus]